MKRRKKRHIPIEQILAGAHVNNRKSTLAMIATRPRLYPWADWCDGSWWEITKGTDYKMSTIDMLRHLQVVAHRRGLRVQSFRRYHDQAIRFQFYTGPKRPRMVTGPERDLEEG